MGYRSLVMYHPKCMSSEGFVEFWSDPTTDALSPEARLFIHEMRQCINELGEFANRLLFEKNNSYEKASAKGMWPCHHCGKEHPIGGPNPCHDAQVKEALTNPKWKRGK